VSPPTPFALWCSRCTGDRIRLLTILFVLALAASACQSTPKVERIPLSNEVRERLKLGDAELRALQYYLSEAVTLERTRRDGVRRVARGRLIIRGGTLIQQVTIPAGTPGVIEMGQAIDTPAGAPSIPVSFEENAPLRFTAMPHRGPYRLVATTGSGWLGRLLAQMGNPASRRITFEGQPWRLVEGERATLLVERDAIGQYARKRRTLQGVRLQDDS